MPCSETRPGLQTCTKSLDLSAQRLKSNPTARDLLAEARKDQRFDPLRNLPEFKKWFRPISPRASSQLPVSEQSSNLTARNYFCLKRPHEENGQTNAKNRNAEAAPPAAAADAPAASAPELTPEQLEELKLAPPRPTNIGTACSAPPPILKISRNAPRASASKPPNPPTPRCCKNCCPSSTILKWRRPPRKPRKDDKLASLQAGIAMIQQQLKGILAETGLEEIDAAGKPFDPMLHEAVSQMETADARRPGRPANPQRLQIARPFAAAGGGRCRQKTFRAARNLSHVQARLLRGARRQPRRQR
jgi:hypothetical protein